MTHNRFGKFFPVFALFLVFFPFLAHAQESAGGSVLGIFQALLGMIVVFAVSIWFVLTLKDILHHDFSDSEKVFWLVIVVFFIAPITIPIYFFMNDKKKMGWMYIVIVGGALVLQYILFNLERIISLT